MTVESRISGWRRSLLARDLAEGTLLTFAWLGGAFWLLLALDRLASLPHGLRLAGAALLAGLAAGCAWRYFLQPFLRWTPVHVIAEADGRHPGIAKYFLPAWELSAKLPPHVSADLAAAHRRQADELAARPELSGLFELRPSARAARSAVLIFFLLALSADWAREGSRWTRMVTPWKDTPLESLVEIAPLGGRLPWGAAVTVSARWKQQSAEKLDLFVRAPDSPWRLTPWDPPPPQAEGPFQPPRPEGWSWLLASLTEPLEFQVRWRDQASAPYALVPVPYPQFSDLRYRITAPAYSGRAPEETAGGGDVQALAGTRVEVIGRTGDAVESAVLRVTGSPGIPFAKGADGLYRASFEVVSEWESSPGEFWWELTGPEGIKDPQPARHRAVAVLDKPPAVELLSPTFELAVGPSEELPVVFFASDDFGLASVELVYRAKFGALDSGERSLPMAGLQKGALEWTGEHRWDLAGFIPDSRLEFFLEATDGARPPHKSRSAKGLLRVVDFEGAHADAMTRRAAVLAGLERLEKQGREAADALRRGAAEKALEAPAREKEAAVQKGWSKQLELQSKTMDSLANDPYANTALVESDRALLADLQSASKDLLSNAGESSAKGDLPAAAGAHEQLAQEAARARGHMEETGAFQSVQDMADKSQKLARNGADLDEQLRKLQEKGAASEEDRKKLQQALKDLQQQMLDFARSVQEFAEKAPAAKMTGEEKIYELKVMDALQDMDELEKALASGDMAAAAAAAQTLAKRLAEMRKTMEEARGSVRPSDQQDPASKKLEELLKAWEEAARDQESVVGGVRKLEEGRLADLLGAQKRLLAELVRRQRAVIAGAGKLREPLPNEIAAGMALALREFESARIDKAPQALEEVVGRLGFIAPNRPDEMQALEALRHGEEEVLAMLRRGADPGPPTEERAGVFRSEAVKEGEVKRQVEGLRGRVADLRREAVFLPREAVEALGGAQGEAEEAVLSLDTKDSADALEHAQKALELLEQGKQETQKSLANERRMEAILSFPAPSRGRGIRRRTGGTSGANTGPVKLPSAQEYQPPQEIRRQVLESMQEKMPPAHTPAIKDYLKKVAE